MANAGAWTCDGCKKEIQEPWEGAKIQVTDLSGRSEGFPVAEMHACGAMCAVKLLTAYASTIAQNRSEWFRVKNLGRNNAPAPDACAHKWGPCGPGWRCDLCGLTSDVNPKVPVPTPAEPDKADKKPRARKGTEKPSAESRTVGLPGVSAAPAPAPTPAPVPTPTNGTPPASTNGETRHVSQPPSWCSCGRPRTLGPAGWGCHTPEGAPTGHTGQLQVKEGEPGENLARLQADMVAAGRPVDVATVAEWSIMKRTVARAWLTSGKNPTPAWIDLLRPALAEALPSPAPSPVPEPTPEFVF